MKYAALADGESRPHIRGVMLKAGDANARIIPDSLATEAPEMSRETTIQSEIIRLQEDVAETLLSATYQEHVMYRA